MSLRLAIVGFSMVLAVPASAVELKPEQAKRFVANKVFAYQCFDGTTGVGRINGDGSVAGTIRMRGYETQRHVVLPANTIRVNSDSICASVRGVPFQPCFNVVQTSQVSFRGSVSGLGFAYCDFTRVNPRMRVAGAVAKPRVREQLSAPVQPVTIAESPPVLDVAIDRE